MLVSRKIETNLFSLKKDKKVHPRHGKKLIIACTKETNRFHPLCSFRSRLIVVIHQCRSKGNISGGARERRGCEPVGGSGGILPQKILKSKGLEMLFPAFSKSYL